MIKKNLFNILGFEKIFFLISKEELENKYLNIQIELLKSNSDDNKNKLEEINNAYQILSSEKTRIDYIASSMIDIDKKKKEDIELCFKNDEEIMLYFFDLNDRICNNFSSIEDIKLIQKDLLDEKLLLIRKLQNEFEKQNFDESYRIFLHLNYIYRTLEIIEAR